MSINPKLALGLMLCGLLLGRLAQAEPYLAIKNNLPCSACHINPAGGGARTAFGAYYGSQMLPQAPGNAKLFDGGALGETLRVGANFRANYASSDSKAGADSSTFETQSGQVYLAFQPKDSRFTFYLDQQVAPGSALTREAFVLTRLSGQHFMKVGKLMLPYGLRLEDDTAFIRQQGFNFDTSDNGVELGLQYTHWLWNFALSNGSSGLANDDKGFQYLARSEYLGSNWRMGGTLVYNDAELGARTQANVFAGVNWLGFVFLAEADYVEDKSLSQVPGTYATQRVGLLEVNREIFKGLNLKLTSEYLDPDTHIAENQRNRYSFLVEYTPFANLQWRTGIRRGEDIPQRVQGNYLDFFTQLHFYF